MGEPTERVLTVTNYGEDEDDELLKTRVTISPGMVQFLISSEEPNQTVDGVALHKVNVLFVDGNNLELFITLLDLMSVERAVGTYYTAD